MTTLTDFIIQEEHNYHNTTGQFTLLLTHIENCAKIISNHVKKSGLIDILGKTGNTNEYGDEVEKLDEFANNLLVHTLSQSELVSQIASEELKEPLLIKNAHSKYSIYFDPIDGSSNISNNNPLGTIFSIYSNQNPLPQGNAQLAAGYIIYGSSVMFVYSSGHGVNGFTLDSSIGSFLLSHPNIQIPKKGSTYSANEGYYNKWNKNMQTYINFIKTDQTLSQKEYKLRYVGTMVADIDRTLLSGGVFLNPPDTTYPDGKLRLMYEVNPVAFLIKQAGGISLSNDIDPLTIQPTSHDQQVPFVCGSPENMEEYLRVIKNA